MQSGTAMDKNIVRLMAAILGFSAVSLQAQVEAGAVFSGDGLRSFYFAVGNYYQVPEREVVVVQQVVQQQALPPEEVPVVFYVAERARIAPAVVVELRRRGLSWTDIAFHFRLDPDIYYFPGGPPYGRAYGRSKKHPPRDVEVIDAVNVHFLSEYHRVAPDVVWAERSRGRSYAVVARDFAAKSGQREHHPRDDDDDQGHGHGKGRGHDR
jgi:hypothetical protein